MAAELQESDLAASSTGRDGLSAGALVVVSCSALEPRGLLDNVDIEGGTGEDVGH